MNKVSSQLIVTFYLCRGERIEPIFLRRKNQRDNSVYFKKGRVILFLDALNDHMQIQLLLNTSPASFT